MKKPVAVGGAGKRGLLIERAELGRMYVDPLTVLQLPHLVIQVGTRRLPGRSNEADDLPALHNLPILHREILQMGIPRLERIIHHPDVVAGGPGVAGNFDCPWMRRVDRMAPGTFGIGFAVTIPIDREVDSSPDMRRGMRPNAVILRHHGVRNAEGVALRAQPDIAQPLTGLFGDTGQTRRRALGEWTAPQADARLIGPTGLEQQPAKADQRQDQHNGPFACEIWPATIEQHRYTPFVRQVSTSRVTAVIYPCTLFSNAGA